MRKRIIAIVAAIAVAVAWGARVAYINTHWPVAPAVEKTYPKGQTVALGKDFFWKANENMDGYSAQVLSARLVSREAFAKEVKESKNLLSKSVPYLYIIKMKIRNDTNTQLEKTGVNLANFILQGANCAFEVSDIAVKALGETPEGQTSFSLRTNSEMTFSVPFAITAGQFDSIESLQKQPLKVVVSAYPVKKSLAIS